jgi:hypothetical protein
MTAIITNAFSIIPYNSNQDTTIVETDGWVGFESNFHRYSSSYYEFSLDGNKWYTFSKKDECASDFMYGAFSPKDLFPANGLDVNDYINKSVYIRLCLCDGSCKSGISAFTIKKSSPHIASSTITPPRCADSNDGKLKVTFERALLPEESLIYNLKNTISQQFYDGQINIDSLDSDNAHTFPWNLAPGSYNFTYFSSAPYTNGAGQTTTVNSASNSSTFTVTAPDSVRFAAVKSDVSCFNGNNGTISLSASGGVGKYEYAVTSDTQPNEGWKPFGQGNSVQITGLSAGTYRVQTRDTSLCPARLPLGAGTDIRALTIGQPAAALKTGLVSLVNPKAYGSADGSIETETGGGTPKAGGSYTFNWSTPDGSAVPGNVSASAGTTGFRVRLSSVPAGKYILTVSDSLHTNDPAAGGCFTVDTFTVVQPPRLTAGIELKDSVFCHGDTNGTLVVHANGGIRLAGSLPYSYQWKKDDGSGAFVPMAGVTDSIANGLTAGRYAMNITDANGVSLAADSVFTITEPPVLQFTASKTDIYCHGAANGIIRADITGGAAGYSYYLQAASQPSAEWKDIPADGHLVLSGLGPDTYTLQCRDRHLCNAVKPADGSTDIRTFIITEPDKSLTTNTLQIDNPSRTGVSDGIIKVKASGGTSKTDGSYDFSWSMADGSPVNGTIGSTVTADGFEISLAGITDGKYVLTVNDANHANDPASASCFAVDTFVIRQPLPLKVTVELLDSIVCNGDANGRIAARASGGIPLNGIKRYLYQWKKQNGTGAFDLLSGQTDSIAGGLTAGVYAVNITDANGISMKSDSLYVLGQPTPVRLTVTSADVLCYGAADGTVSLGATGGTGGYRYLFRAEGATVTEWKDLPAGNTAAINGLSPGIYRVDVKDSRECPAKKPADETVDSRTVTIIQPASPLTISGITTVNPKAYGSADGEIGALVTGGTPQTDGSYDFRWTSADGAPAPGNSTATADASGYHLTLSSAPDGKYILTVTDAHHAANSTAQGCVATDTFTLVQPPPLTAAISERDSVLCNGDANASLTARVRGGISLAGLLPYEYKWKKRDGSGAYAVMTAQTDSIATGLTAGHYALNITDANGISLAADSLFVISEPAPLTLSVAHTDVSCSGNPDGAATASASGGTPPYSYEWNTSDKTATALNLEAGTYLAIVRDRHGCETRQQVAVEQPAGISLTLVKKDPVCHNDCNGSVTAVMTGGRPPYHYDWTGSSSQTESAGNLCAGTYHVVVSDASGCAVIQSAVLNNPPLPPLNPGGDRFLCNGQTIDYDITAGESGLFAYHWSSDNGFASAEPKVTLSRPGRYTASVTNANGCNNSASFTLTTSDIVIGNQFAVPTQAFAGEPIVTVNTTYPAADSIRWVLPAAASVTVKNDAFAEFAVADTGTYIIRLITFRGNCFAEQTKKLIVTQRAAFNDIGTQPSPFIKTFTVAPNPNHGVFSVNISLEDKSAARLRLINIGSNMTVSSVNLSGSDTYTVPVNLSLPTGIYLLLLETPKGNSSVKVLIM